MQNNVEITLNAIGLNGEWLVDQGISAAQEMGYTGRILHNAYVPKNDKEYTEIDVLYITRKGIFVVESKNIQGWIFGNGIDTYWTISGPNYAKIGFTILFYKTKGTFDIYQNASQKVYHFSR